MPVVGADTLAKNIVKFQKGFLAQVNIDMRKAEKIMDSKITENISLTDHSTKDLALMGHPYAARAPQNIHEPGLQLHTQSGEMLRGKFSGTDDAAVAGGSLTARAYVGIKGVEHANYVVYGTSKMVPRDFLGGSLNQVKDPILSALSRSLKNTVIDFQGQEVKL